MNERPTAVRRRQPKPAEAEAVAPIVAAPEAPRAVATPQAPTAPDAVHRRLDIGALEAIASMDADELERIMLGSAAGPRMQVGTKVSGVVTRVTLEEVYVDVGAKSDATIDRAEARTAAPGDPITAWVVANDETGLLLSIRLGGEAAGAFLEEAMAAGIPVEGKVSSRNPGGYEVRVGAVRAFCPASMIDRVRPTDGDVYVGQTLAFLVLEVGDKIVVSRRALLERQAEEDSKATWEALTEGAKRSATVVSVRPFGAFVDVGGVEALLPSRDYPRDAAPVPGTTLEVTVTRVDTAARKVQVSARDASREPWHGPFSPGTVITGQVVRSEPYGAFVDIGHGTRGLLHRSRVKGALPSVGATVTVEVVSVDEERERVELALAEEGQESGPPEPASKRSRKDEGGFGTLEGMLRGWAPAPKAPGRKR